MIVQLSRFERKAPNHLSFLELRQLVIESEKYDPDSITLLEAVEAKESGDPQRAIDLLIESHENFLLTPFFHFYFADLYKSIGDEEGYISSTGLGVACIDGILSTGNGTEEKPYLVLRISEEKDILNVLGHEPITQSIVRKEDKHFDVFECEKGLKYWFDISDFFDKK